MNINSDIRIKLNKFKPRPYQMEPCLKFEEGRIKKFLIVNPRRSGKDYCWLSLMIREAIGGVVSSGAGVIIGSGPVVEGMATCGAGVQLGTIIGGGISNAPQTIEAIEESSKVVAAAGVSVATNIAGETIAAIETGSAIVGALFSGPWCP